MATNRGTLSLGNRTSRKARTATRGKKTVDMGSLQKPDYTTHKNLFNPKKVDRVAPSQRGFFGEDDEDLSMMGWSDESVTETSNYSTTPEQVVAGRIAAGGASVAKSFIENARKASNLVNSGADLRDLQYSNLPSEKLAYMAYKGRLDLAKVSQEVNAASAGSWGGSALNNSNNEADHYEPGFNTALKQAQMGGINQKMIKSPTEQALSAFGAMTVAKDKGKFSVNTPDSVHMDTEDTSGFDQQVQNSTRALASIANLYLPQGSGRSLQNEVITGLGKILPSAIADTGKLMADSPNGNIPWTRALPSAERLSNFISKSTGNIISDPSIHKEDRAAISAHIRSVKSLFNSGNEGGLSRARSTDAFEAKYIADEIAASGVDEATSVKSADNFYGFKVTTDVRDTMETAMAGLGLNTNDLRDAANVQKIRDSIADKDRMERYQYEQDTKKETAKKYAGADGVASKPSAPPPKPMRNESVPPLVGPSPNPVGPIPRSATDYNLAKFKADNPHLTGYIDDGKDQYGYIDEEQHAIWKRARQGKLTSSQVPNLAGMGKSKPAATVGNVMRDALGFERASGDSTVFTESGNILEPKALDWYKRRVDNSAFETGLIFNKDKPGQATTPDAIAANGRKIVEVKSRQDLIDPNNPQGNQMAALQKYNLQMQHQMYVSGLNSADLVQARRGVDPYSLFNPNGDEGNFRADTFQRSDEIIKRMAPVWDRVGQNASKISNLGKKDQAALAKAVEEGNIASFEKLATKHGLDEVAGTAMKGGGGGGGRGGSLLNAWGQASPNGGFGGMMRAGLATQGKIGKGINVATLIAGLLADGATALNDKNLDLGFNSRAAGMSDRDYLNQKASMRSRFYMDDARASQDLGTLARAAGGLSLGFTQGAERLVVGSRGLIGFDDIGRYDGDATGLIKEFKRKARDRGYSDMQMTAIAEQTGLQSAVNAEKASEERKSMNAAFANIDKNISKIALSAGEKFGGDIAIIAEGVSTILSFFNGDDDGSKTLKAPAPEVKKWGTHLGGDPRRAGNAMAKPNPAIDAWSRAVPQKVEVAVTVEQDGELKAKLKDVQQDKSDGRAKTVDKSKMHLIRR